MVSTDGPSDLDGIAYQRRHADGTVLRVSIQRTDADAYPSGWRYTLHYGLQADDDAPLLRYDNAHEREKGHERHTPDGVELIEFPGMESLYDRFIEEYTAMRG